MKVPTITFAASALSGLTLLISLMAVANICREVQVVWSELDSEIALFKAITDDLWRDMITLGRMRTRSKRAIQVEPAGTNDPLKSIDNQSGEPQSDRDSGQAVHDARPPSAGDGVAYPPGGYNHPAESCSKSSVVHFKF
uniref:Col_cuticle_N domain-containing protein n=1 Tax=Ascaris lumbricoides TaxID=6252 RepID=A0A0M3HQ52_ASCLU